MAFVEQNHPKSRNDFKIAIIAIPRLNNTV